MTADMVGVGTVTGGFSDAELEVADILGTATVSGTLTGGTRFKSDMAGVGHVTDGFTGNGVHSSDIVSIGSIAGFFTNVTVIPPSQWSAAGIVFGHFSVAGRSLQDDSLPSSLTETLSEVETMVEGQLVER